MSADGPDGSETASKEQLLVRIAARDREAFALFFSSVAPKVKGYIIHLGASPAAAEEIAQDVMLTVWRKAGQFDPSKGGALTWVFVIARNRRIDSIRRERAVVLYGDNAPEVEADGAMLPVDVAMCTQRNDRVRAALLELSSDQREVVQRAFFDEQPHTSIAAALGLPLGTVKSRLRLAMKKLRDRLEEFR